MPPDVAPFPDEHNMHGPPTSEIVGKIPRNLRSGGIDS